MGGLIAAVFAVALGEPPTVARGDANVDQLSRLESVWNEAHLRGDAEALETLWADDLVVVVPKMPPITKSEAIGFLRSGRMKFERYETSELTIRVYDGCAVVAGRLLRSRNQHGRVVDDDWRFTKVYVRSAEAWRVVAFHASESGQLKP